MNDLHRDEREEDRLTTKPPATPRWVLVIGIVAAVLVLLFIIMHVMGGGMQGHMS